MTQVLETSQTETSKTVTTELTAEELEILQKLRQAKTEQPVENESKLRAARLLLSSEETKAKLLEMNAKKLSTYAMARELGVSQSAAKKHLNKVLAEFTEEQLRRQRNKSSEFRQLVIKDYQKDKNISKLSRKYEMSTTTIRNILKQEGMIFVKIDEPIKSIEQVETEVKTKIEEIAKRNVTFGKSTNIYKKDITQEVKTQLQISKPTTPQKKYDLNKVEQTQHAITTYVVNAMKECKCGNYEIQEYMNECKSGDFAYLLEVSQEYIDECNMR